MQSLQLDKPFFAMIAGLIVSVLAGRGYATGLSTDQVMNWINAIVSGLIAIISIYSYIEHATHVKKAEIAQQGQTSSTTVSTAPTSVTAETTTIPAQ